MRTLLRALTAVVGFSASALCGAAPPGGSSSTFPDEWFFNGQERTKATGGIEGKPAAPISAEAWIGPETALKDQRGKVVVVDFWATWCGPCMAALPENVALVNKYKDKGLVFVGVHDSNLGWDEAPAVVRDKGINYPVAKDKTGGASVAAYKVMFWPTYIAIDRKGIVRATGLIPDHVEDVVKILLAEAGPSEAEVAMGWGPEYYYGGANRPSALRQIEGRPAAMIAGQNWIGTPLPGGQWQGSVAVLHFTSPGSTPARKQLSELAALEKEFGTQGVMFVGVCDAGGTWSAMEQQAKAAKLEMPIVHDVAVEAGAGSVAPVAMATEGGAKKDGAEAPKAPKPTGVAATAYGVRYFPTTIVVDRSGVVRAAGVRLDKTKEVLEKLLGEKAN